AFEAAAGQRVDADVLDVGTGGLFIRTATPVAAGKRLSLEVGALVGVAAWTAVGRVVWTRETGTRDAPPGMGVKLIDADEAALAAIDRAVEAREKARSGPVAVPSRERTVLGLGATGASPVKPPQREPSVQEPPPGDWDLPDVHGMTTRVVEVPRMADPGAPSREEEAPPPKEEEAPPPPPEVERSIAIDLVPKKPRVEEEVETVPQSDSLPPGLRRRGGRWVLLLLVVALAAGALYVARDDIPWVKRLVERVAASPPAPTPAEPASAVPALPASTAATATETATVMAPPAASTVVTWTTIRPPEGTPSASQKPVRPPPSASPRAPTSGAGVGDNPY
ncbi:MAG TPA: PilZ domain-containing protein, partial [Polyangiaceae bacterium]